MVFIRNAFFNISSQQQLQILGVMIGILNSWRAIRTNNAAISIGKSSQLSYISALQLCRVNCASSLHSIHHWSFSSVPRLIFAPTKMVHRKMSSQTGTSQRNSSARGQTLMSEQFDFVDTVEESISDLPPPPPGVSVEFHSEHHNPAERMHHNDHLTEGLVALAKCVQTQQDADIFATSMRTWRLARHAISLSDGGDIIRAMDLAGANNTLLRMLCDRRIYRLGPSEQDMIKLMNNFRTASLAPTALENEQTHLDQLDSLYKSFAVVLYHEMHPTLEHHSILITAGAYGNTAEGLRRSTLTFGDVISLGWVPDESAVFSLVHANIQQGNAQAALSILHSHQRINKSLADIFKIRAYLSLQDAAGMTAVLEQWKNTIVQQMLLNVDKRAICLDLNTGCLFMKPLHKCLHI
ncbi:hypothetical protein BSLG_005722 [Batrachochytrium salamandrivorans]|nr:hypothetical protein BSLG_005722 [Batrachochytrium salamandrivorans]